MKYNIVRYQFCCLYLEDIDFISDYKTTRNLTSLALVYKRLSMLALDVNTYKKVQKCYISIN